LGFSLRAASPISVSARLNAGSGEKIEEKRIDIAIEALALAYDSKEVFSMIRNPGSMGHEWEDMPRRPNETD
jgi:hypothetical protein